MTDDTPTTASSTQSASSAQSPPPADSAPPNESAIWPVQVFYDGGCPVCSREMRHYCGRSDGERLIFIDIAAPDFRAEDYGYRQADLMAALHARLNDGTTRTGIDAFRLIWQATPRMGWLAWVAGLPGVHGGMALCYRCFAANRRHFRWPRSRR